MRIREVIWKIQFIEKLKVKHGVTPKEVESIIFGKPHILRVEKGRVKGENVYEAFGQTSTGRYLVIFFIDKSEAALPISARDMTHSERRYYEDHK
ncbi:MAG: BrnT family toxin [Nitrospirota bacterium]